MGIQIGLTLAVGFKQKAPKNAPQKCFRKMLVAQRPMWWSMFKVRQFKTSVTCPLIFPAMFDRHSLPFIPRIKNKILFQFVKGDSGGGLRVRVRTAPGQSSQHTIFWRFLQCKFKIDQPYTVHCMKINWCFSSSENEKKTKWWLVTLKIEILFKLHYRTISQKYELT